MQGTKGQLVYKQRGFGALLKAFLVWLLWPVYLQLERCVAVFANHKGSEGTVKFTTNAIAELRGWSVTENNTVIDDTTLTDTWETKQAGNSNWSGDFTTFWDETDTNGQMAATIGASVTLNLYPEGATTGDVYYTGAAIITSIGRNAAVNGMVEATYGFTGNGVLTKSTV